MLITGERGTGKELVARAIHEHSTRKDGPFVKLNCAAIPSELIESELFGHEKGAFTGATQQRRGKFEQAHGGTLFLDEIGDMTLSRAGQGAARAAGERDRARRRQRDDHRRRARGRGDQQGPASSEIEKGRFRADLYDRLNVVPIEVPPLRERREDVPALVEHFLEQACAANGKRAADA